MSGDWDTARLPRAYSAASRAMAKLSTLDECVKWKNKGQAMASYARQMNDTSLHEHAVEVRERAKRRFGQIVCDRSPAARGANQNIGSDARPKVGRQAAARAVGVKDTERKEAQRLAKMPDAEFEGHVKRTAARPANPVRSAPAKIFDRFDWWVKGLQEFEKMPWEGFRFREGALPGYERALKTITALVIFQKKEEPKR